MAQRPIAPDREAARFEGMDVTKHGPRRTGGPEGKYLIEAHWIGRGADFPAGEQGLGFGGEPQIAPRKTVEQWAHTEPTACQEHPLCCPIVDRGRTIPSQ